MNISPFDTSYDVAILGGGLIGASAALTLAQAGKQVLLVERRPLLGWEITSAFKANLERTRSPAVRYLHRSISAIRGLLDDRVDPPLMEILLDQLAEKHNIDVLLFSQPTELLVSGDRVTGVRIGNKSGEQTIRAATFIDATEEALLWQQTGARWQEGDAAAVRTTFFMHVAPSELELPQTLGDASAAVKDVRLFSSVRRREVGIEYTTPGRSLRQARLAVEAAIRFVRDRLPELAEAAVTQVSVEPFPLGAPQVLHASQRQHPTLENLFAAGLWAISDAASRASASQPAGRIELGEATAKAVLATQLEPTHESLSAERTCAELAVRETDVLVVGGGTAGALATIAAGRQGAEVVCLEASPFLGGMVTGSGQDYGGHGVKGGLQDEFHARVSKAQPLYAGKHALRLVHSDNGRAILEQMAAEVQAEVVCGATSVGVEMEGERIRGVIAATPQGKTLFRAKVVIDSSGDADVARKAGAPFFVGREHDGVLHAYSQVCYLMLPSGTPKCTNHDSGYCDPHDIVDLTRARREGIRQVWARFAPEPEGGRPLITICPLLGLRQGPIVIGDYQPDFLEGILPTEYDDCVGYSGAKYDCHSQDFENQFDAPILWVWMLGNRERHMGNQMAYRMMLPKRVDGMLVACRSASSTQEYNYQFRTIRNQHRLGEAAGIAAAYCVKLDILPRALDVSLVQAELHKSGALGEAVRPKPVVPERPLAELRQMLTSNDPKDAVWLLAHGGEKARVLLKDFVHHGPEASRFWAAVALAWHKDDDALPELIAAVDTRMAERSDYTPRSRNMVPLWQPCIVMLGRIGSPKALPVLLDVLADPAITMDALIAAVRALGRIGDPRAVPALQALLTRDDLPRERTFQQTNPNSQWPEREDGLWQVELAIAEVLADFHQPQPHVVEKYQSDPRSYVRRYATKIQRKLQNLEQVTQDAMSAASA